MIYNLSNPFEIDKFRKDMEEHIAKQHVLTITRKLPQRSSSQNKYLYVILAYFSAEYGLSVEETKQDIFKRTCNPELFARERLNKHGQLVRYLRSSSELTTGEMTTAIERFRNWSSAEAGVYLPSPNEEQFLLHCEQEIERNKQFL